MAEGSIKKLTDKGFGFINTGGAKDLFFHSKSVQGVTFEALHEGQKVSYNEGRGPKRPLCRERYAGVVQLKEGQQHAKAGQAGSDVAKDYRR